MEIFKEQTLQNKCNEEILVSVILILLYSMYTSVGEVIRPNIDVKY